MSEKVHVDEVSGTTTTGHEWDGIRELNNPLPKWWAYLFFACIVWAVGYWVVYPAWPYLTGEGWTYTKGVAGYTERSEVATQLKALAASRAETLKVIEETPIEEIAKNESLLEVALAGGKAAFGDNCAGCHGSGAQGGNGFPNLNDDDWLWGGTLADIQTTIAHGIRWEADENTRQNQMPRFLDDGMLKREQVNDVAEYVLLLNDAATDANAAKRGAEVYAQNCVSCHGADAKGNQELGAPNLTDAIWLYGGDKASLVATISHGRNGVMPAWGARLGTGTVKELALYVHSLGGGK
ncbi:MAG TPA: cytochrome-c oxidase, cbb3-type subunit III [Parvibaculum sp.]|uniref:cytochrome-c oxidase, cbb3-type subunit III n=1 Tax=Parvibaculum sp. TaxID=2024848 RepID=UPI002CE10C3B|nr:cytochrome-c oxidase, cbb3-type subunit III [Parvibaculum sp.]HMM15073.1 cytochrome-c oxidase, cbb3-type subunit III [Parvibaculum sp.]